LDVRKGIGCRILGDVSMEVGKEIKEKGTKHGKKRERGAESAAHYGG